MQRLVSRMLAVAGFLLMAGGCTDAEFLIR
jgi:hypothetical protein